MRLNAEKSNKFIRMARKLSPKTGKNKVFSSQNSVTPTATEKCLYLLCVLNADSKQKNFH